MEELLLRDGSPYTATSIDPSEDTELRYDRTSTRIVQPEQAGWRLQGSEHSVEREDPVHRLIMPRHQILKRLEEVIWNRATRAEVATEKRGASRLRLQSQEPQKAARRHRKLRYWRHGQLYPCVGVSLHHGKLWV